MFESEHSRWQAVQSRSKSAASAFVYAVITTKIFCRPTCPARLARRANVRFYDSPVKAVSAGFRPCKRCKPEDARHDDSDSANPQRRVVKKACRYIEESKGEATLKEVAQKVGISPRYLHGIFKDITGSTPATYAARFKGEDGSSSAVPTSQEPSPLSASDSLGGSSYMDSSNSLTVDSSACDDVMDFDFALYTSAAAYEAVEGKLNAINDEQVQLDDWIPTSDHVFSPTDDPFGAFGQSTEVDFSDSYFPQCQRSGGMGAMNDLRIASENDSSFLEFPWGDDWAWWNLTTWSGNEHVQV
jgi:methylphosphotriester-DNA--protein-cysteine methyltransferase